MYPFEKLPLSVKKKIKINCHILQNIQQNHFQQSHKKRRNSLETHAKLAVLSTYTENQAMLEPIPFYLVSKCKQTKEQGSEDCLWTHIFTSLQSFCQLFYFFYQYANKIRSNCAIIEYNYSKKQKLALYKTQNGEPNY